MVETYEDIDKLREKLVARLDADLVHLLELFITKHMALHEENCKAFAMEDE